MSDDPWIRVADLELDNPLRILAADIARDRRLTLEEAQGAIIRSGPRYEPDPVEVVITAETSTLRAAFKQLGRDLNAFFATAEWRQIEREIKRRHPIPYKRNARKYGR